MPHSSQTASVPPDVLSALAFVEEQTAALGQAVEEQWYRNAIEAIEADRDEVAGRLRKLGYDREVAAAIARGERGLVSNKGKKKGTPRGASKKSRGRTSPKPKFSWTEYDQVPNVEIEASPVVGQDLMIVVARPKGGKWHIGYWTEAKGLTFFDLRFETKAKAKAAAEAEATHAVEAASRIRLVRPRAANREIGDVVLAARQYQRALEDRMTAMDRGTPQELSKATKREKEAKEVLEDMTGANRELLGAIAGATLGAALGGLLNPVGAAVGALAAGAVGSVVARPSLPEAKKDTPERDGSGADVIPLYQRRHPTGPRAANRGRR